MVFAAHVAALVTGGSKCQKSGCGKPGLACEQALYTGSWGSSIRNPTASTWPTAKRPP